MKTLFTIALLLVAVRAYTQDTNKVTLMWDLPANLSFPLVYEIEQTLSRERPVWYVIASNIPSHITNYVIKCVNRTTMSWRMRSVNATNSFMKSDYTNEALILY